MGRILILLLLVSTSAVAQYDPGYTGVNSRYDWLAGKFRALHVPAGTTPALQTGQTGRSGALFMDTTGGNAGLYMYILGTWIRLADTTDVGVTTMAAIGASPNANGATISGSTLTLQPASASFGGVITTGTQTIAGNKSFTGITELDKFDWNLQSIATAAGTTTLTSSSVYHTIFTGSTTQNIQLPDATTLSNGHRYKFTNTSTGTVSIKNNASGNVYEIPASTSIDMYLISNGTSNGTWGFDYNGITYGSQGVTAQFQSSMSFAGGGTIAAVMTMPTSSATIAATNIAQTWTAGIKPSFDADATSADIRLIGHAGDPSSLSDGDLWYNSTTDVFKGRANGTTVTFGSGGGTPGGSDTHVQFNDGGAFGGDAGMVYNKTDDELLLAGITDKGAFKLQVGGAAWIGTTGTITSVRIDNTSDLYSEASFSHGASAAAEYANKAYFQLLGGTVTEFSFMNVSAVETFSINTAGDTYTAGTAQIENHLKLKDISAPSTPASGYGALYVNTDAPYFKDDGGAPYKLNELQSKTKVVEAPGSSENLYFFYTDKAITVQKVAYALRGSSPSVTFDIVFHTDRSSGSPSELFGSNVVGTSTTGTTTTSFSDATIPAGSYVWIVTSAASGTINEIGITLTFKED
jgi:hypothetical protein